MEIEAWESQLDASQAGNLQLIMNSLLGVQILSALRDPIVIGFNLPLPLITVNVLLTVVMLALVIWVRMKDSSALLTNYIVLFALVCTGTKAVASIAAQADPLPFYMAIVMFALSLCFLSQRFMLVTAAIISVVWAMVALFTLTVIEIIGTCIAMSVGLLLGVFVLRRRIASLIEVFELRGRVEDLESILPMCANCKQTRDSHGEWKSIERYIVEHQAGLQVSHGICPECKKKLYPDYV